MASSTPIIFPTIHHPSHTRTLSAAEAQPLLASYLSDTRTEPWMHPDAWLYTEGIRFGPKSGYRGGWAIHHLRRIEMGLRGEKLEQETEEELIARFGKDVVAGMASRKSDGYGEAKMSRVTSGNPEGETVKESDDTRVDQTIKESDDTRVDQMMKQSDDARVDQMIQESEQRTRGPGDAKAERKRKKKERIEHEKANKKRKVVESGGQIEMGKPDEWQRKDNFAQEQSLLEGEVGLRNPAAPVSQQTGHVPALAEHNGHGEEVISKQTKSAAVKAARKAAKKARRVEEKQRVSGLG